MHFPCRSLVSCVSSFFSEVLIIAWSRQRWTQAGSWSAGRPDLYYGSQHQKEAICLSELRICEARMQHQASAPVGGASCINQRRAKAARPETRWRDPHLAGRRAKTNVMQKPCHADADHSRAKNHLRLLANVAPSLLHTLVPLLTLNLRMAFIAALTSARCQDSARERALTLPPSMASSHLPPVQRSWAHAAHTATRAASRSPTPEDDHAHANSHRKARREEIISAEQGVNTRLAIDMQEGDFLRFTDRADHLPPRGAHAENARLMRNMYGYAPIGSMYDAQELSSEEEKWEMKVSCAGLWLECLSECCRGARRSPSPYPARNANSPTLASGTL